MGANNCPDNFRANNQSYFNSEIMFCKHLIVVFIYFYFWLCWVFIASHFSLGVASRGYSRVVLQYSGFALQWLLLLQRF